VVSCFVCSDLVSKVSQVFGFGAHWFSCPWHPAM